MELGRLFGFLHPALVHFPLVLLLVSFGLETVGFIRRNERFAWAAQTTLILGAVATLFAFVCGNFAEIWAARDGIPQEPMELHELYATITSWVFVFLAAGRLFLGADRNRRWMLTYLVLMAAGCVLLVITGHKGAMLVYQHAAGVQLGTPPVLPTHEDLAVLRQKQDPDALFYSNNMHHVFGWMVLIFSGLLLIDMLSPKMGARLRKVTPLLLVAGGIFLLICSDTDSWPLSHQRPITDKEVVMHKTYAVLMLIFGIQGLRRRKKRTVPSDSASDEALDPDEATTGRKRQGRLMAVFSLIGGALLFTHVHSNAPYANVAVGVYIHHTVMGFIALCIGAVKLMEDVFAGQRSRKTLRALAWAYPCLMLTESIFLLNYNEGLPWFLGYRNLSLVAPHHGLIAPLGRERAELVFSPDTMRLDVYLLHQGDNSPYPVLASEIEAVTRVGTESTAVPLAVCAEREGNYHFAGTATFLQGVTMFQVQALVRDTAAARFTGFPTGVNTGHFGPAPIAESELIRPGPMLTADFEPWTDERTAALQHSQAAFICPMHPAVGAGAPGSCSVCGMALVPNKASRPWGKLHDEGYRMELSMAVPRARVPAPSAGEAPFNGAITTPLAVPPKRGGSAIAGSTGILATHTRLPAPPVEYTPVTQPIPGQTTRLTLTPRRADGTIVFAMQTVHTKKLHLIIASRDLSFFDHVHPETRPDGSLILDYAFPAAGDYTLYADCTPIGDRNQVFSIPVTTAGTPPEAHPLEVTPAQARVFGEYRVRLDLSPQPAQPGDETQLSFTLFQNGLPVIDLEPYLGAGGHCVALSADGRAYLHSHPVEMTGTRFGPTVTFHTVFPKPGLYKIWGQFRHHGRLLVADFVVRVP